MTHSVLGDHEGALVLHEVVTLNRKVEELASTDAGAMEGNTDVVGEVHARVTFASSSTSGTCINEWIIPNAISTIAQSATSGAFIASRDMV